MVRLIIIVLALLQEAAEEHRAENHKQIGADDNHYDRDKEHTDRSLRLIHHDGYRICAEEQEHADDAEQRVRFRRLFAEALAS